MSRLLLEKSLETKFMPNTTKETTLLEVSDKPDMLGELLAEELLDSLQFSLINK